MKTDDFNRLEVGDRIEFRSPTRNGARKAIRKITGFPKIYDDIETWGDRHPDWVYVRYEGGPNFYVHRREILRRVA